MAKGTFEGPLACVQSPVLDQAPRVVQVPPANVAHELSAWVVQFHVGFEPFLR